MFIGIDCRTKRDENGELWVRCAPVITGATARQRIRAIGIIAGVVFMLTVMVIGMCATDLPHENIIDVTPKYGVMR